RMIERREGVHTWPYRGYWRDVGTLESYWEAHMDLLGERPLYDLNDLGWLIHTRSENRAPARIDRAEIVESLIAHGCVLGSGARVERSVLSPGVRVEPGAVIRESVVLGDSHIGASAVIERAILDKRVRIGERARIGAMGSESPPRLAVVGKG